MAGLRRPGAAVAKKWIGLLFGVAVSFGAAWLFFRSVSLDELSRALGRLHGGWILAAFAMLFADYAVRSWRWTVMLRVENQHVRVTQAAPVLMACIALNNVLPFRAGDMTRALVFPARLGISRGFAATTLIVERLLDLVFVLLMMALGLFLARDRLLEGNMIRDMVEFGAALAVAGVAGVLGAILFAPRLEDWLRRLSQGKSGPAAKFGEAGANLCGTVAKLRSVGLWALLLPGSALIWTLEAGVFWAVISGISSANAMAEAALLGSAGTLATLVPSTPGYIGTFHLAVQQAGSLLGMPSEVGSAAAILAHAVLWLGTSSLGLAFLLRLSAGHSRKGPPSNSKGML